MYAIVDIETTGGHASANGITDIAILLHDGKSVVHQYETLINPGISIPAYISALTGISDEMVKNAPSFREVAADIYHLIGDKVFVAHNVNFDYSFLKYHLSLAGFNLQCKKLCTVRLGRKIFPGFSSYSLGKLCSRLNIVLENRHRAGGDALATAKLFSMLLEKDEDGHILQLLGRSSAEQRLPPYLQKEDIDKLPLSPGVYYFKNQKGDVIYVGKAINLRKRVLSHFTGNNPGRQRQEFLKNIHSVSFTECGTELMAFILEAVEIKRIWPSNNRAMKRFEQSFGLYLYEDQRGYLRLIIDKKKKGSCPLFSFNSLLEGRNILISLTKKFDLCPKLCFIQRNNECCNGILSNYCRGACNGDEGSAEYNARVRQALEDLKTALPSFMLLDKGRTVEEQSIILMEQGNVYGMGYLPRNYTISDINSVKTLLHPHPSNDYIRNMVLNHASRFPEKVRL
ncbi:DNA polymerase-3 subunit epsilon [Arcticibacter tournemirensis]|uniref:DNA polymerase III subunit epsilon n=1 Tax=Arcticibacter tournemirensis TaxID=699437 RepID=A0A5M9HA79_9SPHI|nr:exonuclease domain-containing protein [Arcticibacter tournemirensis]KAA8483846.1 DNA polymerase III subunit epsilon [Arcticibacter tournemirensis]TQM49937.1 DNA polymerase-3 subunit epsilon [Arcticibacter tournemirensis]